jgi:acetyltransferase-like isoleucine patch superfamily enzyme
VLIRRRRIPLLHMLTIGLLPSLLKVFYYRLRGARIGNNVSIGLLTVLIAKHIEIGEGTAIGFGTVIRGREVVLRRYVHIGSMTFLDVEKIFIDDDTKINEQVFAGGPMLPESELHIGKNCIVMQYTFLNASKPLVIGDGSGIGGHCLLFTHGSWQSELDGYPVTFAPIAIGKNVWLPWRVFILPGVSIGDDVTIGANSLVTRNIPPGSLAAGMPAQVLRTAPDYPRKHAEQDRVARLERMLGEFFGYLEYHGYRVQREPRSWGFEAEIRKNRSTHTLSVLLREPTDNASPATGTTVLILPVGTTNEHVSAHSNMRLNIANASRIGTTHLGEELALFLSRYGLRFYRLD